MSYDPSDCYELSDFGFGPFPVSGDPVVCPVPPESQGYGGSAYGLYPYGSSTEYVRPDIPVDGGYGGIPYGTGAFGTSLFPRPPFPISGGYGGDPYGTGPYGAIEKDSPSITSAVSLDGFRVEIFFSEQVQDDAAFFDPASYTFTSLTGGVPVTAVSVAIGTSGDFGPTSAIITHTGSTLGGIYTVEAAGLVDISVNPITAETANFTAFGEEPTFTVTVLDGDTLQVDFSEALLEESEISGVGQADHYAFTSGYPVPIILNSITHPGDADLSRVLLDVEGMTSTTYTLEISPATAINYDGSILPSASAEFTGVEVGTGSSVIAGSQLELTKNAAVTYGWRFEDTSGKLLPNSSFRVDVAFDVSSATLTPALFDTEFAFIRVSDGAVEALITLTRVLGSETILIDSNSYSVSVTANWSAAPTTVSLIRNQRADSFVVLVNGTPVATALTASYDAAPTISAGVQVLLSASYQVEDLPITSVEFTSSQTIFSDSWNFVHSQTDTFTGSDENTVSVIRTEKGPLTKGWGDATPATENDVEVRINGTAIGIDSVNPYIGEIYPLIPIPLATPGSMTVEVDYTWFPNPTFVLRQLNVDGLLTNKWDDASNGGGGDVWYRNEPLGSSTDDSRFPMRIILGPYDVPQPEHIGHRFIAFEKAYSSLLNSPTSLILNQNPTALAVENFEKEVPSVKVLYDGTVEPALSWDLTGQDSGSLVGDGTYQVVDAQSGAYPDESLSFYTQDFAAACPYDVTVSARLLVDEFTLDGVFTGVGFGLHTNSRLFLTGFLEVNGLKHVGVLTNPLSPELASSWDIGPALNLTITDSLNFMIPSSDLPASLEVGGQFQILTGNQAGIYKILCWFTREDGTVDVELDPSTPFPADPATWGSRSVTGVMVFDWSILSTYRLTVNTSTGALELTGSGEIGGVISTLETVSSPPATAELPFVFDQTKEGQIFWGSLGRVPTNTSTWSFFQYALTPEQALQTSRGLVVATEMDTRPGAVLNSPWGVIGSFGYDTTNGSELLLKSTSGGAGESYGFQRLEAFFDEDVNLDFDAQFRINSGTCGFGDAQIILEDGYHDIILGTIRYVENALATPYRQLVEIPLASLSGFQLPASEGWTTTGSTITIEGRGHYQGFVQAVGQNGLWQTDLDLSGINFTDEGGRIFESRFRVDSFTANGSGEIKFLFGARIDGRDVGLTLTATGVRLTSSGTTVQSYTFDWNDESFHNYRVLADVGADTVTLVIDDVVQAPTVALSSFSIASGNSLTFVGGFGSDTAFDVSVDSLSNHVRDPSTVKRTLGIWTGGEFTDINSFALPRTDGTSALNSSLAASVEEMDWTSNIQVRLHRDCGWGVTVLRPDLADPPFAAGDYFSPLTSPTAAWISVENSHLPLKASNFGRVQWGALRGDCVSQQRWDYVRYRIFTANDESLLAPEQMILNRFSVASSAELLIDTQPEIATVTSRTATLATLSDLAVCVDRVFKILNGDTILDAATWNFDRDTQEVAFTSALPGDHVELTVVYAAGFPVSHTYLANQGLYESSLLLNEGTPTFERGLVNTLTVAAQSGGVVADPSGSGDSISNVAFDYLTDQDDPDALYEDAEFIEVTSGGENRLIHSMCDDTYCGSGLIEFTFGAEGDALYQETFKTPKQSFYTTPGSGGGTELTGIIGQTAGSSGSPYSFPDNDVWIVGGDQYLGEASLVAPSTPPNILYPNYGDETAPYGSVQGGVNQHLIIGLTMTAVLRGGVEIPLEETMTLSSTADNTPPTEGEPSVDGAPGVNNGGAVLTTLTTPVSYSRIGPWAGIVSLEPNSLLAARSGVELPDLDTVFTVEGDRYLGEGVSVVSTLEAAN